MYDVHQILQLEILQIIHNGINTPILYSALIQTCKMLCYLSANLLYCYLSSVQTQDKIDYWNAFIC